MKTPAYKRILLKLSGESLMGNQKYGVDPVACQKIARSIHELTQIGIQVGVVIGGGNIFRGVNATQGGMQRTPADHIGMLATLINGIALQQAFETIKCESRIMSAITLDVMAESYSWKNALKYLEKGIVLIFVGGTGNPYFTTDSAAALRALEIQAEVLMKATKVDGIYNKDPALYPDANKFDRITYSEVLASKLQVMDATAIALCRENRIPIHVFNMLDDSLKDAVFKKAVGTIVSGE
ncbi:MAG: UMP kinase [Chlamydiae bacterium CG10_big_fil_rev_8_21_14_0_10_42_34]|nr:MAG: UMP kinase [Chlamydiae bacterium CG10_big_fil_rev_8_21_14_0_10_42_34]